MNTDHTKTIFEVADEVLEVIQDMDATDWVSVNAVHVHLVEFKNKLWASMPTEMFLLSLGILIERGCIEYQSKGVMHLKYDFLIKLMGE